MANARFPNSQAFSPESLRAAIRGRAAIPEGMLQEALDKLKQNLNAKETKYFSHQGMVMDKREVDALGIQMNAIELIAKMSELIQHAAPKPRSEKVTLKIDPATGAMILIIGDDDEEQPQTLSLPATPIPAMVVESEGASEGASDPDEVSDEELEVRYLKVPRGTLSPELRQALFGEPEVGNGQ